MYEGITAAQFDQWLTIAGQLRDLAARFYVLCEVIFQCVVAYAFLRFLWVVAITPTLELVGRVRRRVAG